MAYEKFLNKISIKQTFSILLMIVCLNLSFFISKSFAWLIFHKPEYKGKVVNAETQEPLEGVVVVAVYSTRSIIGGPAGSLYDRIHLKEALTDKKGEFLIPSYTTIMGPNSTARDTEFIFYKPGYGRSGQRDYAIVGPDEYFTKEIGIKGETYWGTIEEKASKGTVYVHEKKYFFTYGVVKLRPLSTWEERRKAQPARPTDTTPEDLPLLNKIIKKEDAWMWKNEGWRR